MFYIYWFLNQAQMEQCLLIAIVEGNSIPCGLWKSLKKQSKDGHKSYNPVQIPMQKS